MITLYIDKYSFIPKKNVEPDKKGVFSEYTLCTQVLGALSNWTVAFLVTN